MDMFYWLNDWSGVRYQGALEVGNSHREDCYHAGVSLRYRDGEMQKAGVGVPASVGEYNMRYNVETACEQMFESRDVAPMNLQTSEFSVAFLPEEARIVFEGSMRLRSARDYDELKALLRNAHSLELGTLTLDFRGLKFLNSSGIGTIGQFIVEARKADKIKIVLHGSTDRPWQPRSLGTFKRIWSKVELTID